MPSDSSHTTFSHFTEVQLKFCYPLLAYIYFMLVISWLSLFYPADLISLLGSFSLFYPVVSLLLSEQKKFKGGICCGGHLAVTYGGELLYLWIFM